MRRFGGMGLGWYWSLLLGLAWFCLACTPPVYTPRPLPPPPPPISPEPPPQRPVYYVNAGRLNLRAGPGMDFPKISSLERNEAVEKLGETDDWFQVRVKKDGTLGWVASRYLSPTPVAQPPETVTPPSVVTPPPPVIPPPTPTEPAPAVKPPLADRPKPAKPETVAPRPPKPAEAAEPPTRKPEKKTEDKPTPAEKPSPPKEEPASPAPGPPGEKPSRIRIM
uniref:SH3b domain-containing protein n=1 Tax=Desulfobacca acetoxidans TaxID=60893 RepID=A0A7C5EQT5_9BACT